MIILESLKEKYNLNIENEHLPFIDDEKLIKPALVTVEIIWNKFLSDTYPNDLKSVALPRGNVNANIMVVAQNPGGRGKSDYSAIWANGPNSKFVLNSTKSAGIFEDIWFTNLVPYPTLDNKVTKQQISETEHIIKLQVQLIKPKVIIGLGKVSSDNMRRLFSKDCEIIELQHPAYVRRFLSGDIKNREKYIEGFASSKKYL